MSEFSNILRGLREKGGHASARSFYMDSGGRKFFKCTYFPKLTNCLYGADIYSTEEKGADTAFFHIETIVRKVFSF